MKGLFPWAWGLQVVGVGVSIDQQLLNRTVTWDRPFGRIAVAWKTWFPVLFLCSSPSFVTNSACGLGQVFDMLHSLGVSASECGV